MLIDLAVQSTSKVPFLSWRQLPAEFSEFEIMHFFSLQANERTAVSTRYGDSLRLGAALQIGILNMCGRRLDAVQRGPADLRQRLAEQLEMPASTIATLRALYLKRRRTLYEHQRWAIEHLGMRRLDAAATSTVLASLCDIVRGGTVGVEHGRVDFRMAQ